MAFVSMGGLEGVCHAVAEAGATEKEPIKITVEDAILMAFENNSLLAVERLNPAIRRTYEEEESAEFDPVFKGSTDVTYERTGQAQTTSSTTSGGTTEERELEVGISRFFPHGTDVAAELSLNQTDSTRYGDQYESRIGLSVTQALLKGRGKEVNLANLRRAQLETRISQYELRGFSETLLAQVEEAYWDYALARRQIETVQESLRLAEQQKRETEEMISVGKMAETEIVAAQAEIASRRQDLINVTSTVEKRRLALLRLLNPPGENLWQRQIVLLHQPSLPEVNLDDVETHVSVALRMRPDLNQARLGLEREDLEIIKTKNGLLPRMDFFINLGKTGYADSFKGSMSDVTGDSYDFQFGINFDHPLGNRGSKAQNERALLNRDQAEKAVGNLSQLIELDVRTAYIEVNRAEQQISATAETRKLQEEKLRVETERFRVGRSTNFLIAQAQRDLIISQIAENRAVANYLKALIDLYRLEGSLLERRGIAVK